MFTNLRLFSSARATTLLIGASLALTAFGSATARADDAGGIDARCNAVAAAKTLKTYALTRVTADPKSPGNWRLATAQSNAAIANRHETWFADFATVTASGQTIYATIYSSDSSGDGGTGHEYCYASGKLVRTLVDVDDISEDQTWKRYIYYASDGSEATSRTVYRYLGRGAHAEPPAVPAMFALPKYTAPSALPFYAAYRRALAGTLPAL